nr:uncharacterized protein LOC109192291 [Ipomoea batatas]
MASQRRCSSSDWAIHGENDIDSEGSEFNDHCGDDENIKNRDDMEFDEHIDYGVEDNGLMNHLENEQVIKVIMPSVPVDVAVDVPVDDEVDGLVDVAVEGLVDDADYDQHVPQEDQLVPLPEELVPPCDQLPVPPSDVLPVPPTSQGILQTKHGVSICHGQPPKSNHGKSKTKENHHPTNDKGKKPKLKKRYMTRTATTFKYVFFGNKDDPLTID